MKNYTSKVDLSTFSKRYNRSNLSFKYTLVDSESTINKKGEPVINLSFTPSGYDDPKYFIDGEFSPENVENRKIFTVTVSDFEVSGATLTPPQKRELIKTMHEGKYYTQKFYDDYRDFHRSKLEKELNVKLAVMNRFKDALIRSKGEKHYNQYIQLLKQEYRDKIDAVQYAFTQWERT